MRKYFIWAAGAPVFFLMVRLLPGFGPWLGENFSLPALRFLAEIGDRLPFSALEWGILGIGVFLIASFFFKRFLRSLLCVILCIATAYLAVWYPLYFFRQPVYAASAGQIAAVCEALIDELNVSAPDFSEIPVLPSKFARFPGWMRAAGITGICSFLTGEALVSPELPKVSLPFVAVHERMHLEGFAGEGAANIAAWKNCMERGGVFADSARVWALRYGMGFLRDEDYGLYESCLGRMNPLTLWLCREAGGAYKPSPRNPLAELLNISQDYEILAHYLAVEGAR